MHFWNRSGSSFGSRDGTLRSDTGESYDPDGDDSFVGRSLFLAFQAAVDVKGPRKRGAALWTQASRSKWHRFLLTSLLHRAKCVCVSVCLSRVQLQTHWTYLSSRSGLQASTELHPNLAATGAQQPRAWLGSCSTAGCSKASSTASRW